MKEKIRRVVWYEIYISLSRRMFFKVTSNRLKNPWTLITIRKADIAKIRYSIDIVIESSFISIVCPFSSELELLSPKCLTTSYIALNIHISL